MATTPINSATGELNVLQDTTYTVTQGALGSSTPRINNRTAFNNIIARAASEGKPLFVPDGTYEIDGGPLIINTDGFRWRGSQNAIIKQYSLSSPVIHVGQPLGTAAAINASIEIDGAQLRYAGVGTGSTDPQVLAGANALELTSIWRSRFVNLSIGDPDATVSGTTSLPFRGILFDGISGTTPCFSNVFDNIMIKHFGYRGIDSPRSLYDQGATGSDWSNVYVSGGDSTAQRDLSAVSGACAVYFQLHAQENFHQLNIEWIKIPTLVVADNSALEIRSINFEGCVLKQAVNGTAPFVAAINSRLALGTVLSNNCSTLAANNITEAALVQMYDGSSVIIGGLTLLSLNKTSTFVVVASMTGAGNANCHFDLLGLYDGSGNIDRIDHFVYSSGNTGSIWGVASDFMNDGIVTLANASATIYSYQQPNIVLVPIATSNKTITLARQMSASNACRIPPCVRKLIRNTGSGFNAIVNNYDGTQLHSGIVPGASAEFAFDGTNWVRIS